MTTLTLNRNLGTMDFLFVALNDSSFADWNESLSMDHQFAWEVAPQKTFTDRLRKLFHR